MVTIEKWPTYAGLPWGIAYSYQRVRFPGLSHGRATWPSDPNPPRGRGDRLAFVSMRPDTKRCLSPVPLPLETRARKSAASASGCDVGVVDLANHGPLALDLQQVEEVGEAKARDVVGVDACAGGGAHDIDVDEYALSFG
jgi:hypothetical protein